MDSHFVDLNVKAKFVGMAHDQLPLTLIEAADECEEVFFPRNLNKTAVL